MPTVNVSPFGPKPQFFDAAGNPDLGYKLFFYVAGSTSTKQNTYTNSTGSVANSNPIILNALGQTPNELWFTEGQLYKAVLAPSTDTDPPTNPVWTIDNLQGINDNSGAQNVSEWQLFSAGPVFVSTNSFTLAGNQTDVFHIGRRVQLTLTGGNVYGRITNSVFGSLTTVTLQMDGSQALDSSLSAAYYSILSNNVLSLPERIATTVGIDTYTATTGITRYVIGDQYKINFANPNGTTTPTLNLDGLGAKSLVNPIGNLLNPRQLQGQQTVYYNGTNMVVLSPVYPAMVKERNSIQTGANTITAIGTGLNVNLLATTTPIRIAFAGGFTASGQVDYLATLSADVTSFWASQTANVINYNYFDLNILTGVVTGVTSVLPLISQDSTAAVSVVNGQHTYVYDVGIMYVGNGTTATQVYRVPAAQNLAGAATITSVSQYGKRNKQIISGISVALGNGNVFTHGFGRIPQVYVELVNVTAEGGWTAGQVMPFPVQGGYDGATVRGVSLNPSSIDVGYRVSTNAWQANGYNTGTSFAITPANWTMQFTLTPRNT